MQLVFAKDEEVKKVIDGVDDFSYHPDRSVFAYKKGKELERRTIGRQDIYLVDDDINSSELSEVIDNDLKDDYKADQDLYAQRYR